MLYRASVYSFLLDRESPGEVLVFFECPPNGHAETVLHELASAAWHLPVGAIEHYNLCSETELRANWAWSVHTNGADRDTALLQVGDGPDGAVYAKPATTMLMVSPYWHQRLATAQEQVARMQRLQEGQRIFAKAAARMAPQRRNLAVAQLPPANLAAPAPRNLQTLTTGVLA